MALIHIVLIPAAVLAGIGFVYVYNRFFAPSKAELLPVYHAPVSEKVAEPETCCSDAEACCPSGGSQAVRIPLLRPRLGSFCGSFHEDLIAK